MTVGFRDRDGLSGVRGSLSIPGTEEHTCSVHRPMISVPPGRRLRAPELAFLIEALRVEVVLAAPGPDELGEAVQITSGCRIREVPGACDRTTAAASGDSHRRTPRGVTP